jgi:hypothetical protein
MRFNARRKLKPIIAAIAVMVGATALLFVGVMAFFFFQERDEPYWSRLYLTRQEILDIAVAVEKFRQDQGRYPENLQALLPDGSANGKGYLKVSRNAWGTVFFYRVEHGPSGERFKVWTIPDRETQDKLGLSELSNQTAWDAILKP